MRVFDVFNYLVTSAAWFVAGAYGQRLWDMRAGHVRRS